MHHSGAHFAHASYLALAAAAKSLGKEEIANVCMTIAEEEKAAADWSEAQLTEVVDIVLARQENE